jgi:carboxypeptidase C (cathepsin A)
MADNSSKPEDKPVDEKPILKDQIIETKHTISLGGKQIAYTVNTGTIVLKEETEKSGEQAGASEGEKPKASVFFIAYTLDTQEDKSTRPLTFSFNGGPGSSSVWLHLGLLGPRRVLMESEGWAPPPPHRLIDNEYSLLAFTDLVFIDPVSTGFSRPVVGEKAKEYHSFKKDIESVGDFIRLYTTRYERWFSPKFIIGESYGTTRAAGLSGYLQDRHGLYLNGIMLISSILQFQTTEFDPGNDLPFIFFLPTYSATAWYHKKLEPDLQKDLHSLLVEVQAFALNEYALALLKGSSLSSVERQNILTKLARYTGLDPSYLDRTDLRINIFRFTKELLRREGQTVGRLDTRFKGIDRDSAGEFFEFDPSMAAIMGPYTAALNDYVRTELKFESDLPYEILNPRVWPWTYDDHENRYVNVGETLRKSMTTNPYLRLFVANGFYDLATPYFATEYTLNHLGLDASFQKNISLGYYEAGHMMYIHQPSLEKLSHDLVDFIKNSFTGRQPQ